MIKCQVSEREGTGSDSEGRTSVRGNCAWKAQSPETSAHGPVRVIVQNGAFVEPLEDKLARYLTQQQELAEQDYLADCLFSNSTR